MSTFKKGDVAWCFEFPQHGDSDVNNIQLDSHIKCGDVDDCDSYHTRREALNALAARLKELGL